MTTIRHHHSRAYIAGGGIAGLAAAVYLIREAGVDGRNITLFNQEGISGGAMDGSGSPERGYLIRGGRMHEEHFVCLWDLLSQLPTLENPDVSVKQEVFEFNQRVVTCSHSRLLKNGKKLDASSYGLSSGDIADLLRLNMTPEALLGAKRIDEWFSAEFFDTVFWQLWATTFAFQRWSSLMEMRRYAIRFIHLLPGFNQLKGIMRTVYNQYDSVIQPIETWLRKRGVKFRMNAPLLDVDFALSADAKRATAFHYLDGEGRQTILLGDDDYLFVTLGSIVESSSTGTMASPAPLKPLSDTGAWALWERIAKKDGAFGRPQVFCGNVEHSKWMSFTVTLKDPTFFQHMEQFTGNTAGTGGLVTITDSNWFMSVVLAKQPHFRNQPEDVFVFWGDGLLPDQPGNFVTKPMVQCSGAEILTELFSHLGIVEKMAPLLDKVSCVPCTMPYIDSEFMPRSHGDRPQVIPAGAENFAFLGQFVELPNDCVFTVEYSVRSAQTAVFGLLGVEREVTPLYRGDHDINVLMSALEAIRR
ncbi:MAG TPA: oleate hydratase [Gammaproteobacteria bacterium]